MIPEQFDTVRLVGSQTIYLQVLNAEVNAPYLVKFIDGLGPPEFDVSLTRNQDAFTSFESRFTQGRQLIFRVSLNPDYSDGERPRGLRSPFYGLITPEYSEKGPHIEVIFSRAGVDKFWTRGYISQMEMAPFNQESELQITMICSDPYLHAIGVYSHASFSSTSPLIVPNYGSAPTGFLAKFAITSNTQTFDLRSGFPGWGPHLLLDAGTETFQSGDEIHINTDSVDRFVGHRRGGVYIQTYKIVSAQSTGWPNLVGGDNSLSWDVGSDKFSWISLQYVPKYWGI